MREGCKGEARDTLESLCMKLPTDRCLPGVGMDGRCDEHEFSCGDGQCIHGLGVCDHKYQCMNGADEINWYVMRS